MLDYKLYLEYKFVWEKMDNLILFDVDKTLIESDVGSSPAFSYAFNKIYGVNTSINIINHQGMTDQQIISGVLKIKGLNEEQIKSKINKCMESMAEHFYDIANSINFQVLEGVYELLDELKKNRSILGLVTGNIEQIARKKLGVVRLEDYFLVGGFGNDDISRTNLVRIAIKRAGEYGFLQNKNQDKNVYLFGDTPLDIKSGNEAGVATIGVCTGNYSREELEKSSADYVIDNLKNKKEILNIIYP